MIPLVYGRFKPYCENNGYKLLRDDYHFIIKQLHGHSKNDYKAILREYLKKWDEGIKISRNRLSEQNSGRFSANQWLLLESKEWIKKNR